MNDDKPVPPVVWGLLGPVFDWTEEQRAAAEPEPPSNIIYLADYRPRLH
jgi:hypothetical protein